MSDSFSLQRRKSRRSVSVLLAIATLALFWPLHSHEFLNFDDDYFVTANPHIATGLTWANIKWVFVSHPESYWRPVTSLSYMLDCQIFGLKAGAHHLSSLALHIATTLLLFSVCYRMTDALWRSAFVAALFAWHPLHVESVAWTADRVDLLAGFFFMLSLWAYLRYVAGKSLNSRLSTLNYILALTFFALALMSKPVVVILPILLLLLDYWPLLRFSQPLHQSFVRLSIEKLPFFLLSGVFGVLALGAQTDRMFEFSSEELPFKLRLANAVISCFRYLRKFFWPNDLIPCYLHPGAWPGWQVAGAVLILIALLALGLLNLRRRPYLIVGMLWFLVALLPVLGLTQTSLISMADRYTYLPLIGLFLIVAWGGSELMERWHCSRTVSAMAVVVLLAVAATGTWFQTRYWKTSETLWKHTIDVAKDNLLAHYSLGVALASHGKSEEAILHYNEALRIYPNYAKAHNNLAILLTNLGRLAEARDHLLLVIRLDPKFWQAYNNVASVFKQEGRFDEAIAYCQRSLEIMPKQAGGHYNLGLVYYAQGKTDQAIDEYKKARDFDPAHVETRVNLGILLNQRGDKSGALNEFREAVRLNPNHAEARNNLGSLLLLQGLTDEAIVHLREAVKLKPDLPDALANLGAALMQKRAFTEAISCLHRALSVRPEHFNARLDLAKALLATHEVAEAIAQYEIALDQHPDSADIHYQLASLLILQKDKSAAVMHLRQVIRLNPKSFDALNNLAWILATDTKPSVRDGPEALKLARRASELTGNNDPMALDTLAAACAEADQFPDAVTFSQKAQQLATSAGQTNLAAQIQSRLRLYRAGHPYHEPEP
jgi:tetratricopeptide (TPR) repeat protein